VKRTHLWVLAALLTASGLGLCLYKVTSLGFPLTPSDETRVWRLQARFTVEAVARPVSVVLQIPDHPPGYTLLDEHFVSRGFGVNVEEHEQGREARWAIRQAEGPQTFYYRVEALADPGAGGPPRAGEVVAPTIEDPLMREATAALAAEARRRSADTASLVAELLRHLGDSMPSDTVELLLAGGRSATRRAEVAATVLRSAGVAAQVAYGVTLGDRRRHSAFQPLLEVWDGHRWEHFDPLSAARGLPEDFFVWWRGDEPLIAVAGARNPEVSLWVQADLTDALAVAERRAELARSRVVEFSLLSLPLEVQAVYRVMLLVPIGAFLMVVLRNLIGFKTFGTFMPVLIALSFRETDLLWGLVLFTLVTALGLSVRFYLERLHLLIVPRVAAVLTLVVALMVAISILSDRLDLPQGLSVALFPLVILTMAIERLSIVWEERGPREAIEEGLGSLAVAAICYLVMSLDLVEYLAFVFPELLLVVLAGILLLGRYRGYRLTELSRFRALAPGDH
jgi:hypothetical protein